MRESGIPPNLDEGPITPLRQAQQASSQAAYLVLRACVPVLSDLRHAYHTHGEASLPASSMNSSGGLLSARRRPEGLFGLLEAHTRASLARNCHIESLPLATFQLIPPWNCLISSGRKKCMQ